MIDNMETGGAALVKLPCTPYVWRASRVSEHGWNGFHVPFFDSETALEILKAEGLSHVMNNGTISYWDVDNGGCELESEGNGLYSFSGWCWEVVEVVPRHVVDAVCNFISNEWELEWFTSLSMETVESWLWDGAGHIAENVARDLLDGYASLLESHIDDMDDDEKALYPRVVAYMDGKK